MLTQQPTQPEELYCNLNECGRGLKDGFAYDPDQKMYVCSACKKPAKAFIIQCDVCEEDFAHPFPHKLKTGALCGDCCNKHDINFYNQEE
jgi:hypothetical protein